MADTDSDPEATLLARTREIIEQYDETNEPISEAEIANALRALGRGVECRPLEYEAEYLVFTFCETYENRNDDWGTYYAPMFSGETEDGTRVYIPSISDVDAGILAYWSGRIQKANNPVLRTRYADLIWDLSRPCTGQAPDYRIAHVVIDGIVQIAEEDRLEFRSHVKAKLSRALALALALNDENRIRRATDAIIAYEDKVAEDDAPGLFGFAYDMLWNQKRIMLSDTQKSKLVGDLEARLSRTKDPWAAEACALRLAKHYRALGETEDVRRVLMNYSAVVGELAAKASPMQATMWLEQVCHVFFEFELRGDADCIAREIQRLGSGVVLDMKRVTSTVEIAPADLEKFVESITEGDLRAAITKITLRFVPSKADTSSLLDELKQMAPMTFLISTRIVDHRGRFVTSVGPLDADQQGHLVFQMSRSLSFQSLFLREVMSRFTTRLEVTASGLTDVIFESPVFEPDMRDVIQRGVQAYLEGDHLVAVHLLIPQIENALRNLVEKSGGSIFRLHRDGGFDLRLLGDLLSDASIEGALGPDASFYLRVVLTDRRGWNLRNNVCHGFVPGTAIGRDQADRVIHILLLLGRLREHKSFVADEGPGNPDASVQRMGDGGPLN